MAKRLLQQSPIQPQSDRRRLDQRHQASDFRWIDSRGAMAHLGFASISVLYYHITQNRLPFGRVGGRYRFRVRDLDRWVEGQQAALKAVGF